MFVSKYDVRLDSKNRIIVPLKLREARSEGGPLWAQFYLTPGTEGCISVHTPAGFEKLMEEMGATQQLGDANLRTLQRLVAANADLRECDAQGRIVLSDELRVHAGIKRDAIWIGAVNRAEIWDKERWVAYNKKHLSQIGENMDIVSRAGLALPEGASQTKKGPTA